ncbi:ubiquitin carboxyl-terminal hydrolase 40-like [Vombatus ursinus]|uniref:USP domain-containing protein n=1 Tax=Vombatus ursinus TaxID=29139 RepID=A0A4X2LUF4_VOMUR|nr:ubiquitin carboxyl-terminal hydrolase 40-like [Vombatus ursinus]XP_027697922.1 ubiquitin carboxyl-terminal hydrolase 40-like [Vombatus ursinus]XP_027697931.1 ubiquitin carboxyl-terminal hydrolase 40-like [Vombatus ursinus]XP_027697940.1 ubiquitin carboxyl-terminal hydrolase 40-like [Vombatus ursinus]
MFGDLFEEDFPYIPENHLEKGRKSKCTEPEPPPPRGITNLSGIQNQGGTCYLNSLLQTLHFTPEFREALFALDPEELGSLEDKDDPDAKVRVIPLQLQRLFAQLLLSDQQAVSTTDLTNSFGWNNSEEMRQHDVQELNRILFSALESSLVGTSGHDLINRLYHGTIVNHIMCKECENVSERQEDFLDLTVAVKNLSGLEEALWSAYVDEEFFDAENLYHCGTCNRLVSATKSARLRKLPPFLTISLLRFNFDFAKCERYKETGCYTFPLRMDLKPFCEQTELDDSEYVYDLFSVIIHKGGCYGGHYHVYIKDVDQLGNWQFEEDESESVAKAESLKDLPRVQETDNPLTVLKNILSQEENKLIPVDQLGQKLLASIEISWNKKYRKQHGSLLKFLHAHSDVFLLSSNPSKVCLRRDVSPPQLPLTEHKQPGPDAPSHGEGLVASGAEPAGDLWPEVSAEGPHWFDINDSQVEPIREADIEKQFQGKESAYMLFYRKMQLQRPPEAQSNPQYKVPGHLLREVHEANRELQKRRTDYDSVVNTLDLHLHLGPCYEFYDGALHPSSSVTEDCMLDLTIDKRKTVGDLRQSVFQLLEFWEGDLVLSLAKLVPAGLHVCQALEGDGLTLHEIEMTDGEDIFVWNGMEVGGVKIPVGEDALPILLNILQLTNSSDGENGQPFEELHHVFPSNAEVGSIFTALASPVGILLVNITGSRILELENWTVIPRENFGKTFREQGLQDGSCVWILSSSSYDQSLMLTGSRWASPLSNFNWMHVKNLCQADSEEEHVKVSATTETMLLDIRIKAVKELGLQEELVNNSCLRLIDRNGQLLSPVPEHYTVAEAEMEMGSLLGLCRGKAPTSSQLFLFFIVGSDFESSLTMEIIVESTISVSECLKKMLEKAGLQGDAWHLRKMDWCFEAGEPLNEENASLSELMISSGDTLVLSEGKLPPKGFLKVPVWWYHPSAPAGWQENPEDYISHITHQVEALRTTPEGGDPHRDVPDIVQPEMPFTFAGDVEISEEASVADLKSQVMSLPSFLDFGFPSADFLRAWTMESKRPGRLLRNNQQQLKEYKVGGRTQICIEPLQERETLGPKDMLLRTQMGIPGERAYYPTVDFVWDILKECTAVSLRQGVAAHYCLPVDGIEIAKYFPEKFEWMPISSWDLQVSKRKKKKKQENLQMAPYYLKDGDIIGVKNLLVDGNRDFSTLRDDVGRENQTKLFGGKRRRRQAVQLQRSGTEVETHVPEKPHRPETGLSINVGVFR